MPNSQYVTWKWVAVGAVSLLVAAIVGGWNAHAWATNELENKLNISEFINQQDDTKWIKQCMITKCWDKPAPPP
jgi:hypothetical protein